MLSLLFYGCKNMGERKIQPTPFNSDQGSGVESPALLDTELKWGEMASLFFSPRGLSAILSALLD